MLFNGETMRSRRNQYFGVNPLFHCVEHWKDKDTSRWEPALRAETRVLTLPSDQITSHVMLRTFVDQ